MKTQVNICPICNYHGIFKDLKNNITGDRLKCICPKCGSAERHRLQFLVIKELFGPTEKVNVVNILHFAPEKSIGSFLNKICCEYKTADLFQQGVDLKLNLERIELEDESYDLIYASHVLEHVQHDTQALKEIRRVLTKNGIAILPVPIVCEETIEYPKPNPAEHLHWRAPGIDYFDKYKSVFSKVKIYDSEDFDDCHQTYVCEDRSIWPNEVSQYRMPMKGNRHKDYVPICYK